jgi:DNA-directed RNA polymerase omega subunit
LPNTGIGNIDSKFRFIILAARRTRQLQGGARPMVPAYSKRLTRIAQEEVAQGLVKYEIPEVGKLSKKRAAKNE